MKSFEELTGASAVASWVPADVYADLILDGVVCYGQLSGVVTAMEYDFAAGGGDTIQVRYVSPRTHSCTTHGGDCQCLSATSTTFGTYNIPVYPWGDYDLVCGWSIFEAKGNIVANILDEMGKRMAKCRDEQIWQNLTRSITPGKILNSRVSCGSGDGMTSCCTFSYDLYNSVISLQKYMQGQGYEPDYLIMHPTVAQYLYWRDAAGYHYDVLPGVKFDGKGQLTTVGGMKVIECCNANPCNTAGLAKSNQRVQAVVIDSKRAIGEVWGKRPTFEVDRQPECDRYKHVLWMYWGVNELDTNAIGWLRNP